MKQKIDDYGRVIETEDSLVEQLYNGTLEAQASGDFVNKFNHWCSVFDVDMRINPADEINVPPTEFHKERQSEWLIPEEYKTFDLEGYLVGKCTTDEQLVRVAEELSVFATLGLYDVLRAVKYAVDTLDAKGITRGVGRGSSVASYCLYLLGVHMVDSMKYDLDFGEFLSIS